MSRYLGSGSTIAQAQYDYYAMYTLKAQNTSQTAQQGVRITHGPIPYNLTFDPLKSTQQCYVNQKNVECVTDIGAGQPKDIVVAYKTTSSFSCASARFLQTAKATPSTGSGSSSVVVGVSCAVQAVDRQASLSSSSSSFAYSSFSSSGSGTMASSFPTTTYASGSVIAQTGYKPGYKPYTYVMPRTGAGDYFASLTTDFIAIPRSTPDASVSTFPLLLLSLLSAVVLLKIGKSTFSRK